MSELQVTFLGTGTSQGVPVIACQCEVCQSSDIRDTRTRTSVLLHYNGKNIVIDTGPDFRQQMLREKVMHLDAILFTHEHKDHISGMDDIRAFNYVSKQDMPVYVTPQVEVGLRREFHYVFADLKYPGIPKVVIHQFDKQPFELFAKTVVPIEVMHYKLPVMAFRIDDFTYITDANYISPEEKEKIKGSKILVVNALRQEPHVSHFTLEEALELIAEIKPQKAYLTHISHLMGSHEAVSKLLPEHVEIAYDGLKIDLS